MRPALYGLALHPELESVERVDTESIETLAKVGRGDWKSSLRDHAPEASCKELRPRGKILGIFMAFESSESAFRALKGSLASIPL